MAGFFRDYKSVDDGRRAVGVPVKGDSDRPAPEGRHRDDRTTDAPGRAKPFARGKDRRDSK